MGTSGKTVLATEWKLLGKSYFRRLRLYDFNLDRLVGIEGYLVSAAPYGGPIAFCRLQSPSSGDTGKPLVFVFSSSGIELANIRLPGSTLVQLGWTNEEQLLCVQHDGTVLKYSVFGEPLGSFPMGEEARAVGVAQVCWFPTVGGTGIVILTNERHLYIATNVNNPRVRKLTEIAGLNGIPSAWVVATIEKVESNRKNYETKIILANGADLYSVDENYGAMKEELTFTSKVNRIVAMAVSFNNKYLAMIGDNGVLWMGLTDLSTTLREYDTERKARPVQLAWCGTSAVVCAWDDEMIVVGPSNHIISYNLITPVHLVSEQDCVRMVSGMRHELLQKVPAAVKSVFEIGSDASGSFLYEAYTKFAAREPGADEFIRSIRDSLSEAADTCMEAAGHMWQRPDSDYQKTLLRAASFGRRFLTNEPPEPFVDACQTLRVLNAVRALDVGIPLTLDQFRALGIDVLIDRLVARKQFCLASRICEYIKIPGGASRVLAHWACYKVGQTGLDDDTIAKSIADRLGQTPGVCYADVAEKARAAGRNDLAIKLLNHEVQACKQIPLLIKMDKHRLALDKATESCDTDLIRRVTFELNDHMQRGEFFFALNDYPEAFRLYLQHCRKEKPGLLADLFYQQDNHQELACSRVRESFPEQYDRRTVLLLQAQSEFSKGKCPWAAKATEEQLQLLRFQHANEDKNEGITGKSLHETVRELVLNDQMKAADQLKKDFKISDRVFWRLKVQVLAERRSWTELEKFASSKKSPIGYKPFVDAALEYGSREAATKHLQRALPEEKVQCLLLMGHLDQAAELAMKNRSEDDIRSVLRKCGQNAILANQLNAVLSKL